MTEGTDLEQGLAAVRDRSWQAAFRWLSRADQHGALGPVELEQLALSAYLVGDGEAHQRALERAHTGHLTAGAPDRAVRCAFWLALTLLLRRKIGPASGWLARAQRVIDDAGLDGVERGYLLVPRVNQHVAQGDLAEAQQAAVRAAQIGEQFGEAELVSIARHQHGRVLILRGRLDEGLSLLDEAMIDVTAGRLGPLATGLVYCSVIDGCREAYAFDRAREWTDALVRWCDAQADLVAFTSTCLAHRAAILCLQGSWTEALAEAQRACAGGPDADGLLQQAEVHRLRGALGEAEAAYGAASRAGAEVQPGLARLRWAQGRVDDAVTGIRPAVLGAPLLRRPWLRFARVEILIAAGAIDEAAEALADFEAEVVGLGSGAALQAMVAHARGLVRLASGQPQAALPSLRAALGAWRRVGAPYHVAQVRRQLGRACEALGDTDGARLELDAARAGFEALGARSELAPAADAASHPLTERELQVLRRVAAGRSNRQIASELGVSARTVDRHLSNIFGKIEVTSRVAATAWAYQHDLV